MDTERETEVENRDSDAEVAGWLKRTETCDVDLGRLQWELEADLVTMYNKLTSFLSRREFREVKEGEAAENARQVQAEVNRLLTEFEELKWRRRKEKKEARRVRSSGGREQGLVTQQLMLKLNELSEKVRRKYAMLRDLPMENTQEGQATKVDLPMGSSEEDNATTVDLLMGNAEECQATKVDLPMMDNLEEDLKGYMSHLDLPMGNAEEGQATKVDLPMGNSVEGSQREISRRKRRQARQAKKKQRALEKYEEYMKRREEEERNRDPEEITDPCAYIARMFEKKWNLIYRDGNGRFEDNTSIPCKRYTINPVPGGGCQHNTLQVFSVKVTQLTGALQWPLDVFGMVALRDSLDYNRNIIFKRERDNCQTLTDKNPYLVLTGPVRGVLFCGPVVIEVLLYVRCATESDDKELSLLAASVTNHTCPLNSYRMKRSYTSRLSTLDFELGHIIYSVEATISVKVISGPSGGFHGVFIAATESIERGILLHISGDDELHFPGDEISLSRSVVTVESDGKLMVSVRASDGSVTSTGKMDFKPLLMGISTGELPVAELCQLEITVAWSLLSTRK